MFKCFPFNGDTVNFTILDSHIIYNNDLAFCECYQWNIGTFSKEVSFGFHMNKMRPILEMSIMSLSNKS